ncbi:formyltetrahydrofolate deformylase [Sphingopyxis terrae]|uniref:formyltetrahydrofolate deformylase n=1 Tax=Sphingopyxis terrae TaxID=33052 RepID=UPI002A115FBB|nr:formyltetrahydrofolate deformylase [Sphingopyxis terrae]MDX8356506.1 formyltetrahydrofolate deformylase [Sphingopyxis terrae]
MTQNYILKLRCPDRKGIVAAVTTFIAQNQGNITESHQYQDDLFFLRVAFAADGEPMPALTDLARQFAPVAEQFEMTWQLRDATLRPRVMIAVSKFGHCLHDLLRRWRAGLLPIDVVGVVSNHEDMRSITEFYGLPFHHLPVTRETKTDQEGTIMRLIDELDVDLVVLARYMQILSPELCAFLAGRCINIHHSFLPSFKGAKPYHQAHDRGVKVIGATAHYVTTDLDEGPIIEQDTRRVNHARTPEDLVAIGQEVECSVLARAVAWHAQCRVLMNGSRTIVFE